ncbi:MAG: class I SAM-dependent methyltransferase [Candidatus Bathyarchaeota archaeon]|nr:class I SAM-dependent methyltransferase [Candidatus Bathyarchaeota archaeon]
MKKEWLISIKQRYERGSNDYDRTRAGWVSGCPFVMELGEIMKVLEGGSTLEVGTGTGKFVPHLNHLVGVDIALNSLRIAKRKGNSELICADAHNLPFRESVFHNIICSRSIKFFPSLYRAFSEMHRVLRSEGRAIITTDYCRDSPFYRLLVPRLYKKIKYERHYSLQDIYDNLGNMEMQWHKYFLALFPFLYEYAPRYLWTLLMKLDEYLRGVWGGWFVMVILTKGTSGKQVS